MLSGDSVRRQLSLEFEATPGDSGFQFRVYKPRGIGAEVFGVAIHPLTRDANSHQLVPHTTS